MKICVYAISKNESLHVERFCEAAKAADLIFVADTGSTDDTVDKLLACGAQVQIIHISPWRFDDARNAALAMLPADIDVCVSLDLDEILQPGWREEIERVWIDGATRMRYGFDWGCGIAFQYEKIHGRHGYRWHHPCHEFPVPDRIIEKWVETFKLLVIHKPDNTKPRSQYLDLLRVSIEEDPHCPRNGFYYARELMYTGQWHESIVQAKRYLALPRATWPNERAYAMRVMGKCYQELNVIDEALKWHRAATLESPDTREPWADLAMLLYRTQRWSECLAAAMSCLAITHRENLYTVDPAVWGSQPHDLAAIAAWNLGISHIAVEHGQKAVDIDGDDLRLRANLKFFKEKAEAA